ncbi:TetR-like C-terminal domain-containing protein [Hyphomonas sp.]|uniref:TetR-like C-terminal domain-containing protein n=1 Tax=Hyphomonas sp. TaxID=87 RepID=UPI003D2C1405
MTRPGGRTLEVTERVLSATMMLLEEGGIAAVTFQRVAEKAKVGRATLYRRWPEPAYLVADALAATAADRIRITDTGSLRGDLKNMLSQIGQFIESPTGRAAIIAGLSGREQPEVANLARQLWSRRRKDVAPIFERAAQRGEIGADTDIDIVFGVVAGALYARMIVMAKPIDKNWIDRVLTLVIADV